jgi:restriction system protein
VLASKAYQELSQARASARYLNYGQPEDFGYDFRQWISPYTKGAHATGSVAIVLQDWASADLLAQGVDPVIQTYGRAPSIKTNVYLEQLVQRTLGLALEETYVTNAFPYIKSGSMSSALPSEHVRYTVERFTKPELELAQPRLVLALGRQVSASLRRVGLAHIELPHPAARIGNLDAHERRWRDALR